MHPPLGWLSCRRSGTGQCMAAASRSSAPMSATVRVQRPDLKVAGPHKYRGGEVNRGIIGVIIGILVIIILVIVILQLT
jgi:hypothetical protein